MLNGYPAFHGDRTRPSLIVNVRRHGSGERFAKRGHGGRSTDGLSQRKPLDQALSMDYQSRARFNGWLWLFRGQWKRGFGVLRRVSPVCGRRLVFKDHWDDDDGIIVQNNAASQASSSPYTQFGCTSCTFPIRNLPSVKSLNVPQWILEQQEVNAIPWEARDHLKAGNMRLRHVDGVVAKV